MATLTIQQKKDKAALRRFIGRKIRKREFLAYLDTLDERGLSVSDVLASETEKALARLWFALNQS